MSWNFLLASSLCILSLIGVQLHGVVGLTVAQRVNPLAVDENVVKLVI